MGFISYDNSISLTPQGLKHASTIWFSLGENYKKTVIQAKEEYNQTTDYRLISLIVEHFPEFVKNSVLKRNNVDDYFDKFWKENQLTDSYFVEIVRQSSEDNA